MAGTSMIAGTAVAGDLAGDVAGDVAEERIGGGTGLAEGQD